jgi:hypothetical protein
MKSLSLLILAGVAGLALSLLPIAAQGASSCCGAPAAQAKKCGEGCAKECCAKKTASTNACEKVKGEVKAEETK